MILSTLDPNTKVPQGLVADAEYAHLQDRRRLSNLARSGSTKFRWKPMIACWKDILSGYNFHVEHFRQIHPGEARNYQSSQQLKSRRELQVFSTQLCI